MKNIRERKLPRLQEVARYKDACAHAAVEEKFKASGQDSRVDPVDDDCNEKQRHSRAEPLFS